MTPEEFRRLGRDVVDWIADYMERVEELPVLSKVAPGEVRERLPASPPESGEPFETMLRDVEEILLPGITHWQHPSFFAYFPSNRSGPSILGELLSAGLGVQGMLWSTSPACTELETHVMDWLVEMLDLPEAFLSSSTGGGVIQDSASSATLCALLAARERATAGEGNRRGLAGDLTAYASEHAHSSIEKAVRIAGLGSDRLRLIPADDEHAMRADLLRDTMRRDREAGFRPCFVTATVGTTSSNAIDPVAAIAALCREHEAWLHVDAAMSGTAAVCPELRGIHDGVELADSYCFNPHKWMLTNFDCDAFWVRDREALVSALTVLPEYLRNEASATGRVIDYRDWQIPLGRRFRALKLWFVIRWFGVEGLRAMVRRHVAWARELAGWVTADETFELAAPVPLNLVCFRHRGGDETNRRILDTVNASGEAFLTHTRLDGELTLRICVGQEHTTREDVERVWDSIRASG